MNTAPIPARCNENEVIHNPNTGAFHNIFPQSNISPPIDNNQQSIHDLNSAFTNQLLFQPVQTNIANKNACPTQYDVHCFDGIGPILEHNNVDKAKNQPITMNPRRYILLIDFKVNSYLVNAPQVHHLCSQFEFVVRCAVILGSRLMAHVEVETQDAAYKLQNALESKYAHIAPNGPIHLFDTPVAAISKTNNGQVSQQSGFKSVVRLSTIPVMSSNVIDASENGEYSCDLIRSPVFPLPHYPKNPIHLQNLVDHLGKTVHWMCHEGGYLQEISRLQNHIKSVYDDIIAGRSSFSLNQMNPPQSYVDFPNLVEKLTHIHMNAMSILNQGHNGNSSQRYTVYDPRYQDPQRRSSTPTVSLAPTPPSDPAQQFSMALNNLQGQYRANINQFYEQYSIIPCPSGQYGIETGHQHEMMTASGLDNMNTLRNQQDPSSMPQDLYIQSQLMSQMAPSYHHQGQKQGTSDMNPFGQQQQQTQQYDINTQQQMNTNPLHLINNPYYDPNHNHNAQAISSLNIPSMSAIDSSKGGDLMSYPQLVSLYQHQGQGLPLNQQNQYGGQMSSYAMSSSQPSSQQPSNMPPSQQYHHDLQGAGILSNHSSNNSSYHHRMGPYNSPTNDLYHQQHGGSGTSGSISGVNQLSTQNYPVNQSSSHYPQEYKNTGGGTVVDSYSYGVPSSSSMSIASGISGYLSVSHPDHPHSQQQQQQQMTKGQYHQTVDQNTPNRHQQTHHPHQVVHQQMQLYPSQQPSTHGTHGGQYHHHHHQNTTGSTNTNQQQQQFQPPHRTGSVQRSGVVTSPPSNHGVGQYNPSNAGKSVVSISNHHHTSNPVSGGGGGGSSAAASTTPSTSTIATTTNTSSNRTPSELAEFHWIIPLDPTSLRSVLLLTGIPPELRCPYRIAILCGVYGNVVRVRLAYTTRDSVETGDSSPQDDAGKHHSSDDPDSSPDSHGLSSNEQQQQQQQQQHPPRPASNSNTKQHSRGGNVPTGSALLLFQRPDQARRTALYLNNVAICGHTIQVLEVENPHNAQAVQRFFHRLILQPNLIDILQHHQIPTSMVTPSSFVVCEGVMRLRYSACSTHQQLSPPSQQQQQQQQYQVNPMDASYNGQYPLNPQQLHQYGQDMNPTNQLVDITTINMTTQQRQPQLLQQQLSYNSSLGSQHGIHQPYTPTPTVTPLPLNSMTNHHSQSLFSLNNPVSISTMNGSRNLQNTRRASQPLISSSTRMAKGFPSPMGHGEHHITQHVYNHSQMGALPGVTDHLNQHQQQLQQQGLMNIDALSSTGSYSSLSGVLSHSSSSLATELPAPPPLTSSRIGYPIVLPGASSTSSSSSSVIRYYSIRHQNHSPSLIKLSKSIALGIDLTTKSPYHRFTGANSKNLKHICSISQELHISGLPPKTNVQQLITFLQSKLPIQPYHLPTATRFGKCATIPIPRVRIRSGRPFGSQSKMAFLTFDTPSDAILALIQLHDFSLLGTDILNRFIAMQHIPPPPPPPPSHAHLIGKSSTPQQQLKTLGGRPPLPFIDVNQPSPSSSRPQHLLTPTHASIQQHTAAMRRSSHGILALPPSMQFKSSVNHDHHQTILHDDDEEDDDDDDDDDDNGRGRGSRNDHDEPENDTIRLSHHHDHSDRRGGSPQNTQSRDYTTTASTATGVGSGASQQVELEQSQCTAENGIEATGDILDGHSQSIVSLSIHPSSTVNVTSTVGTEIAVAPADTQKQQQLSFISPSRTESVTITDDSRRGSICTPSLNAIATTTTILGAESTAEAEITSSAFSQSTTATNSSLNARLKESDPRIKVTFSHFTVQGNKSIGVGSHTSASIGM